MFDRVNIHEVGTQEVCAHGGEGLIRFARITDALGTEGECNFIDLAHLPPGVTIGQHTHGADEEEFYLILSGSGSMTREKETFRVRAGDLIRNPPGGTHTLANDTTEVLSIFVFEVATR